MAEMEEIHGSLLRRPGFSDDKNEEEEKVERMTREITQIFFRFWYYLVCIDKVFRKTCNMGVSLQIL